MALTRWYVVARQDASARWEFFDAHRAWGEVLWAQRFVELSEAAAVAKVAGGDATPWEWAMQFAAVEHAPESEA